MYQFIPLLLAACATANPLNKRVSGTSTVNLGNNTGAIKHLASGMIYGIPDTPNQVPDHFYTDIGFNYARAGGAQVGAPGRGWIWGLTEYKVCTIAPTRRFSAYQLLRIALPLPCPTTKPLENTEANSFFSFMIFGVQMELRTLLLHIQGTTAIGLVGTII